MNKITITIGDSVRLTDKFLKEGREMFGRDFCQPKDRNHRFKVIDVITEGLGDNAPIATIKLNGYKPKHWVTLGGDLAQICVLHIETAQNN